MKLFDLLQVLAMFFASHNHRLSEGLYSVTVIQSRFYIPIVRGRRGRDGMVFGFTTTHAISAYHH
jgi:hypothetical protein